MWALADFYPAHGGGADLTEEVVQEELHRQGVSRGVDWEGIAETVGRCNRNGEELRVVAIARGTRPTPTLPERIGLKKSLLKRRSPYPAAVPVEEGHNKNKTNRLVWDEHGIRAGQLGSQMGPHIQLFCGIDFRVSHRLAWIQDRSTEIAEKLKQLERRLSAQPENPEQVRGARRKLARARETLRRKAEELVVHLDKDDSARICVAGKCYPGVYVEISHVDCHRRCSVLDKERGKTELH